MTENIMKRSDRRKRRNCRDRWRYHWHQYRRKPADPAMSTTEKLSALLLFLVGNAPVLPAPVKRRAPMSQPLPARADVSPEQGERESGEGGQQVLMRPRAAHGRYRSQPPYSRIMRDLSRPTPAAQADAAEALLARVPIEALELVYLLLREKDWRSLRHIVQPGMSDADAEAALKIAAREAKLLEVVEPDDSTPDDDPERKPPR